MFFHDVDLNILNNISILFFVLFYCFSYLHQSLYITEHSIYNNDLVLVDFKVLLIVFNVLEVREQANVFIEDRIS